MATYFYRRGNESMGGGRPLQTRVVSEGEGLSRGAEAPPDSGGFPLVPLVCVPGLVPLVPLVPLFPLDRGTN